MGGSTCPGGWFEARILKEYLGLKPGLGKYYSEALSKTESSKVKAVTPNPSSLSKLLLFLRAFRDWTQYVINEIWELDRIPSMRKLHHRFYKVLRRQGFRAHHCHKIERRAREVVKATKNNNGSKPVLRKLTARLDHQDYKLNLNTKTLRIAVLNNEWVELKLQWYSYLG